MGYNSVCGFEARTRVGDSVGGSEARPRVGYNMVLRPDPSSVPAAVRAGRPGGALSDATDCERSSPRLEGGLILLPAELLEPVGTNIISGLTCNMTIPGETAALT